MGSFKFTQRCWLKGIDRQKGWAILFIKDWKSTIAIQTINFVLHTITCGGNRKKLLLENFNIFNIRGGIVVTCKGNLWISSDYDHNYHHTILIFAISESRKWMMADETKWPLSAFNSMALKECLIFKLPFYVDDFGVLII